MMIEQQKQLLMRTSFTRQWDSRSQSQHHRKVQEVPIPAMSAEMQANMAEAAVNVDDTVDEEPMHEWDRDNPDTSVGTLYPSMKEFRLAVRQQAIVHEFEYDIEHSDKDRFGANCSSVGCPWIIRARTQHDGSVRVYFFGSTI